MNTASISRNIPATLISQHPDNATIPYWHTEAFVSTQQEAHECFLSFSELGASEYKWDWEGKLVDESVIERLFSDHFDYFQKHPLGKEKFLTFRLPNPKVETEFRLGRAFMGLLGAAGLAKHIDFHTPPLFEVILPMTESAAEMIEIQEAFQEMNALKHPLYKFDVESLPHIEMIPLFEQVNTMIDSDSILSEYTRVHEEKFKIIPPYIRPYLARSDPALNSGLIPTVLAIVIALSRYACWEERTGIPLYPIIGSASLPFRGGLTPYTVQEFIQQYAGVRTALLQSAFRYDFPLADVKKAIALLESNLHTHQARRVEQQDEALLLANIPAWEQIYRSRVESIASLINTIATQLPKRRERVQHIGLFGYSRGVGTVQLPRAIGFTAALYSLGMPPEIIGTGEVVQQLQQQNNIGECVERYYTNIKFDLRRAGRFVHKPIIARLAETDPVWQALWEDVQAVEQYLGEDLGPRTPEEEEHAAIVSYIHEKHTKRESVTELIERAACLRHSMG